MSVYTQWKELNERASYSWTKGNLGEQQRVKYHQY